MKDVLSTIRRQRHPRRRPTRRPRWIFVLAILAAAAGLSTAGFGVYRLATCPPLTVRKLAVRGQQRLDEARLRRVVTGSLGRPILLVDLKALRTAVEAVPGVRRAWVARRMPDTLDVRIEERRPVARVSVGGAQALVDAEGGLFPAGSAGSGDLLLPQVTGLATPLGADSLVTVDRPVLRALAALAGLCPPRALPGVSLDLQHPDRILVRLETPGPVLWLDRGQPERNLNEFFSHRDHVVDLAAGRPVDLRFPHRLTLVPSPGGAVTR